MTTTRDWVGVLEAAYDLSGDADAWMHGLLRAAEPVLNAGHGVSAQLFRLRPLAVDIERAAYHGPEELAPVPLRTIQAASAEGLDLVFRSQVPVGTMSEMVWSKHPAQAEAFSAATGGRFQDSIGIVAHTGTGTGLAMNSGLASPRSLASWERVRWTQVCAHVAAGLRLRERLGSEEPEAILSPDGRVVDARAAAEGGDAREGFRQAVRRIERARGPVRGHDPQEALQLWEGLVGGRWSLVDRFESDGRRYLVAHRNDPQVGNLRGLSLRERQVAEFAGLGRTPKETGYILGLSSSTITNAERRAREKLGLASRSELASFFAPAGLRRRLTELELGGGSILMASVPIVSEQQIGRLTPAEREVALLAVQGATNAAIATHRSSAERTVANQLRAVFERFGVHSRAELAAFLANTDPGPNSHSG